MRIQIGFTPSPSQKQEHTICDKSNEEIMCVTRLHNNTANDSSKTLLTKYTLAAKERPTFRKILPAKYDASQQMKKKKESKNENGNQHDDFQGNY